ncbi:hypothetical protein [Microbacterium sp. 2MCAF23]|uniref:hypothetical protein n=1 Tax=Microbacterium sp. 2MCAF23 TaxID=3232985 RepID=UPI003F948D5D
MTTAGRAGRLVEPLRAGIAVVLVAAAVGLAGCTPGPAPKPTPTPLFTSEAEAFKAAEQAFGRFVDAKNQMQNGGDGVDPQEFLAGSALEDDIQSARDEDAGGTHIEGVSTVVRFTPKAFDPESRAVDSVACLDISKSRVVDAQGKDVTPPTRQPVVALSIKTMPSRSSMRIFEISGSAEPCG